MVRGMLMLLVCVVSLLYMGLSPGIFFYSRADLSLIFQPNMEKKQQQPNGWRDSCKWERLNIGWISHLSNLATKANDKARTHLLFSRVIMSSPFL